MLVDVVLVAFVAESAGLHGGGVEVVKDGDEAVVGLGHWEAIGF